MAAMTSLVVPERLMATTASYDRHGPLAVADARTLVWMIGRVEQSLVADIEKTGATVVTSAHDPLVELTMAQRLAVEIAAARGLNPDEPRNLTRSIVLA
jgi:fructoselysine-6-P-deglycase FrlB-like protein